MDVSVLRSRIQSTVHPNADLRRQAELDLRYVSCLPHLCYHCVLTSPVQAEEQPGFLNALLEILQAEQDNSIRLSSIFSRAVTPSEFIS